MEDLLEKYKTHIEKSIDNAEHYKSKLPKEILSMTGYSGLKTRHFYNNLLSMENSKYLEIGTWMGSSVCSAMYGNSAKVLCIDNWSQFGGPKNKFLHYFNLYKGTNDAQFMEGDCFQIDVSVLPKFNIYMYDGDHEYQNHYKALIHFLDCLEDIFIFVVDDWNWENVRLGTHHAIRDSKCKILYEKNIRMTTDNSHTEHNRAIANWWNGIYVCILQKS